MCGTLFPPFTQNPADEQMRKRKRKKTQTQKATPHIRTSLLKQWAKDARCYWCKRITVLPRRGCKPHGLTATRDHVYPKNQREGLSADERGKFVLSCANCNSKRSDTPFEKYKQEVAA